MIIHLIHRVNSFLPCRQGWTEKHAKELKMPEWENETCQFDSAG